MEVGQERPLYTSSSTESLTTVPAKILPNRKDDPSSVLQRKTEIRSNVLSPLSKLQQKNDVLSAKFTPVLQQKNAADESSSPSDTSDIIEQSNPSNCVTHCLLDSASFANQFRSPHHYSTTSDSDDSAVTSHSGRTNQKSGGGFSTNQIQATGKNSAFTTVARSGVVRRPPRIRQNKSVTREVGAFPSFCKDGERCDVEDYEDLTDSGIHHSDVGTDNSDDDAVMSELSKQRKVSCVSGELGKSEPSRVVGRRDTARAKNFGSSENSRFASVKCTLNRNEYPADVSNSSDTIGKCAKFYGDVANGISVIGCNVLARNLSADDQLRTFAVSASKVTKQCSDHEYNFSVRTLMKNSDFVSAPSDAIQSFDNLVLKSKRQTDFDSNCTAIPHSSAVRKVDVANAGVKKTVKFSSDDKVFEESCATETNWPRKIETTPNSMDVARVNVSNFNGVSAVVTSEKLNSELRSRLVETNCSKPLIARGGEIGLECRPEVNMPSKPGVLGSCLNVRIVREPASELVKQNELPAGLKNKQISNVLISAQHQKSVFNHDQISDLHRQKENFTKIDPNTSLRYPNGDISQKKDIPHHIYANTSTVISPKNNISRKTSNSSSESFALSERFIRSH